MKRSCWEQGEVEKDEMGAGGLQGASAGQNQSGPGPGAEPPLAKPAADAVSAADSQVSIMRCAVRSRGDWHRRKCEAYMQMPYVQMISHHCR